MTKCPLCDIELPDWYKQFTEHDRHYYHTAIAYSYIHGFVKND